MKRLALSVPCTVVLILSVFALTPGGPCWGQISTVGNDQSPPIPGAGHDYIHSLVDTVNPANGSLSVRIQIPAPNGRQLTLPFAFAYDSNGVHYPISVGNGLAEWNSVSTAGWVFPVPSIETVHGIAYQAVGNFNYQCPYTTGYIFRDSQGSTHALNMSSWQPPTSQCQLMTTAPPNVLSGGDGLVKANSPSAVNYPGGGSPPVSVANLDGTVYYFSTPGGGPSWVEDRNGNRINYSYTPSTFVETDTAGRVVLSASGLGTANGTLSVSGFPSAYQLTWASIPFSNFSIPFVKVGPSTCTIRAPGTGTEPNGLTVLTLPNGQSYHFSYESTYGLLKEIDYPTGGWVKYTWGLNPTANIALFTDLGGNSQACAYQYGQPVVTKRQVSFDGTSVAEEEDFTSYTTTWNPSNATQWTGKSTQVTTHDNVRVLNFLNSYTYNPINVGNNDPTSTSTFAPQVPVESQIVYHDWNGTVLRTVNETWNNQFELASKTTTLDNNQTSKLTYSYLPFSVLETEHDEYDYGQSTPTRKTVTNYAAFPNTPIYPTGASILDRPCQTLVYDGSNNRVAETDYLYDNGTAVCGAAGTPSVSAVSGLPSGTHDETNYAPTSNAPRGNLTTETKQCFPNCQGYGSYSTVVSTYTYDETGQVLSMKDPNGNVTSYSYADSYTSGTPPGSTNAYLTKITHPQTGSVNHIENFSYAYADGQLTQSKDQNLQITTYAYNDPLDRPTETDYPDGGQTLITYNDSVPSVTVSRKESASGQYATNVSVMDLMGHVTQIQSTSDPGGTDYITTTYDGLGRAYTASNPYRTTSDPTYGITTYNYDALGRVTLLTHPDASTVQTTYAGRAIQMTDEGTQESSGSKKLQRISQYDALGRLTSVCEVSSVTLTVGSSPAPAACNLDIGGTGFLTTYQYDTLGNLRSVSQGGINGRSFTYNSLSRLVCSANPEIQFATCPASDPGTYVSGTTRYLYDQNGNLDFKYSPAPNQTNPSTTIFSQFGYDALNRVTLNQFSDGTTPPVLYYYDQSGKGYSTGRLTEAGVHNNANNNWYAQSDFTYDPMGRITAQEQCGPLNCPTPDDQHWKTYYSYDLLGNILSSTNGMGVTVSYPRNAVGQITGVTSSLSDANHPSSLFSSPSYNAPGAVTSAALNAGTLSETLVYTTRLQIQSYSIVFGHSNLYNFSLSYTPNGDVMAVNDGVNGGWSYLYDDFNRLASATQPGQPSYSNVYDRYGNRWKQTYNGGCASGPTFCLTFDNNNHVNNGLLTYDAAGNVASDNMHHYVYDAENHLISVDSGTTASYVYDYAGNRVRKTANGLSVDYIYDLDGHAITEVSVPGSGAGTWNRTEIYADGGHIATYSGGITGTTYFNHADWLGTERARTGMSHTVVERCTSLPFGDNLSCTGTDTSPLHFTGKQRDGESGLDNFGARYNSSSIGRFMSPDSPSYSNHKNPQSWNLYAFAINNPVSFRDADGHEVVCANNVEQCGKDAAAATGNAEAAKRVTTKTETTNHSFLGIKWTTTKTTIAITGDTKSFAALSPNAAKLAGLVNDSRTVTVTYDRFGSVGFNFNFDTHGGSTSLVPSQKYTNDARAWIDPANHDYDGIPRDQDAIDSRVPESNTGEEFAHEVLGHIWGELLGGAPAGTRANMRDSIIAEDAVRALDPTRGQKGLDSHHDMPSQ